MLIIFRISFLLPNNIEHRDRVEKINNVIRRLPKMAELAVHSKITPNRGEMIVDFLLMLSASLQNIQVSNHISFKLGSCNKTLFENRISVREQTSRMFTCSTLARWTGT